MFIGSLIFDVSGLTEMLGSFALIIGAQLVVATAIIVVLRKLLLSDTMNAVRRLKNAEAELARKEGSMRHKMEEHEQEFMRKQSEADEALARQKETAEQDIALTKERTLSDARGEADRIVSEAQLNKDKILEKLHREVDGKAVLFAGDLFSMVVSKEVNEKINMAFVAELITALEAVDETSIHVEANEARFVSSHKLDSGQKAKLEGVLAQKFDVEVHIDEEIDESLLAGLIIKLGSLEIDGSLLNRYKEGLAEVKKKA